MPGEEIAAAAAKQAARDAALQYGIQGINVSGDMLSQRWQRKWLEKTYETQKKDALEQWNRENAYNSPKQQMQRLKEAGLNPNLVYGKGADNISGQVNMPRMGQMQRSFRGIDGSQIAQIGLRRQQYEQMAVQTNNTKAITDQVLAQTLKIHAETNTEIQRLDNMIVEKERMLADIGLTNDQRAKIKEEIEQLKMRNAILKETIDDQVEGIRADVAATKQHTLLDEAQMQYLHGMTKESARRLYEAVQTFPDRRDQIKFQNSLIQAQTTAQTAQAELAGENKLLSQETRLKVQQEKERLEQLIKKEAHWANSPEASFVKDIIKTLAGVLSVSAKL